MKRFNQLSYSLLLLFSLTLFITACKDKTPPPLQPVVKVPTITTIDPATAPVGSTIAINGTNFDPTSTSNIVTIGGVPATVVIATPTRIVVTVPVGAVAGPIVVSVGGQTTQSTTPFTPAAVVPGPVKPVSIKQGNIASNQNWTSDSIYVLRGRVFILENYTVTIAAGTIIKGAGPEDDPEKNGYPGALVVERIGRLIARGTPTQPIVFTSAKPSGQRNYGDWGGVVFEGKSPINRLPTTPYPNGIRGNIAQYGEPFDNSGVLQYVRIEYAGALQPTVPAVRLPGLSLIGVGAGTVIDHVQVSYSGGDAFSWFGGSVNLKNVFAYRNFDDDFTADWGYVGNVQFGVSLRDSEVADQSGSNGFEVENYTPDAIADVPPVVLLNGLPQTAPVFANISSFAFGATPTVANSAKGNGAYKSGIYLRRNSAISIYNSVFYGYPEGLRLESIMPTTGLTDGTIDIRGVVLANALTPVVGGGMISNDQATAYFPGTGRSNQVIPSTGLATLLLNSSTFSLTAPNFLPQPGSPLLTGAVTGGKVGGTFFTPVTYQGAFGTDNWVAGWTNLNPQATDYTR